MLVINCSHKLYSFSPEIPYLFRIQVFHNHFFFSFHLQEKKLGEGRKQNPIIMPSIWCQSRTNERSFGWLMFFLLEISEIPRKKKKCRRKCVAVCFNNITIYKIRNHWNPIEICPRIYILLAVLLLFFYIVIFSFFVHVLKRFASLTCSTK